MKTLSRLPKELTQDASGCLLVTYVAWLHREEPVRLWKASRRDPAYRSEKEAIGLGVKWHTCRIQLQR
mgnify:CR=1 FL=1